MRREAGKRNSRGRSINSAPKRRKTDEDNTYEETRTVANQPLNDEIGEKRKLVLVDEKELPATKKSKIFQKDIMVFINTGVYTTLNKNTNEINSRNIAQIETRPPSQDRNKGFGFGTEEEI